MSGAEVNTIAL